MPVSFTVATHSANPVNLPQSYGLTPEELLAQACEHQYKSAGKVLGSSFTTELHQNSAKSSLNRRLSKLNPFAKQSKPKAPGPGLGYVAPPPEPRVRDVIPTPNGFVNTLISAYNKHHNLIVRPDDVWIAILAQFNFYVNAHAELLRANFVAHEGKKELKVQTQTPREAMDFAALSRQMVGLLATAVVDPTLRAWVMPDFSTTTLKDQTVGAIVMMSTLKAYFEYVFEQIECGIPRVTIDGTKADWEDILRRLEKLKEYGLETIAWYHLLVPVISRFVSAFDAPDAAANVDFWQKVAHFEPGGSGPSHYSGWINAFCVFNEEGKWIGLPLYTDNIHSAKAPESLSAKEFWKAYLKYPSPQKLVLDETPFHMVESKNIPAGYVEVPVKLASQGDPEPPWPCIMVAGVVGTLVSRGAEASEAVLDTVQPVLGWWIYREKET
ncbi:hypothetical protein B0H11DRAFT_1032071 [Mycena galericulata]|nr:hypothetical protein B0H11DRAFT_1032071 [Mycena galericulata]